MSEVWVLGATGRSGRAIAAELSARQVPTVLVGRDPERLRALARAVGGSPRTVAAGSVAEAAAALAQQPPDVLATEAVVLQLCAGRPVPARVRVDALAAIDVEPGRIGAALAASIIEGVAIGGRRYERGRLVPARLGADVERLVLPDGSTATTGSGASGELEAARRASGSHFVVAASG